jgi:predicted pyridoxine 5'-phosphate oxidase superfamily flavin-nucleotide-binding protein
MAESDWNRPESPFHKGEQALQKLYGVKDQMESFARGVIRHYMPMQHREFYAQLPLLNIGTLDDKGRVWSSVVTGQPGFLSSTGTHGKTLRVNSKPLPGDPLNETLVNGGYIGVLGLELHTRRRNRMSGRINDVSADGFNIDCIQSFGNCRQFIQARQFTYDEQLPSENPTIERGNTFSDKAKALITKADTLIIATVYGDEQNDEQGDPTHGADVSHRGGKPGFVRIDSDTKITWPDFRGNFHFNTLGNLVLNPAAGLMFIDYEKGDVLYITGKAQIIWDSPEIKTFDGAERLMVFNLDEAIFVEGSLPLSYRFDSYSPSIRRTGGWEENK